MRLLIFIILLVMIIYPNYYAAKYTKPKYQNLIKAGDKLFERGEYEKAVEMYEEALRVADWREARDKLNKAREKLAKE